MFSGNWKRIGTIVAILAGLASLAGFLYPESGRFMGNILARRYPILGWAVAAALFGLVLLCLHCLRSRRSSVSESEDLRVYYQRRTSDEDMLTDLSTCTQVTFLGISHSSLHKYLRDLLKGFSGNEPLATLRVVYASDADGCLWEGSDFHSVLRSSRLAVAGTITDPTLLPGLNAFQHLSFMQSRSPTAFGGCLIQQRSGQSILYVVHYLPASQRDTKDALTIRVGSSPTSDSMADIVKKAYSRACDTVIGSAARIGDFSPTLWDRSAEEWGLFVDKCDAYHSSMRMVAELGQIDDVSTILDLGAGTGHTSQDLLKLCPSAQLTVLDASPQMVLKARSVLGESAEYALCRIPPEPVEDPVDMSGALFDLVVIHLALPAVACDRDQLRSVAEWCKRRLGQRGRVVLAAHNTAVSIRSSTYDPGTDPLRHAIRSAASDLGFHAHLRDLAARSFTQEEVEVAFGRGGYAIQAAHEECFPMTMDDRVRMWRTPAVLNDLIDVRELAAAQIHELMSRAHKAVGTQETPPLCVKYWVFGRAGASQSEGGGA